MGSNSSSSNSSESVNGLKFGHKIYFEDVGVGVPAKSGGVSPSVITAMPPPAQAKKGRTGGGFQGGQPPRCQVEGCNVDLSDAKAYYSRHKVCGMHSKSPKVVVSGIEQRFCQQCSRFHLLPEFDQGKRSCRRRLAGHNERRRKPPPGSLLSTRHGNLSSSLFGNNKGAGGFLMNFSTYPRLTGRETWPLTRASEQVSGNQHTAVGKFLPNPWEGNLENSQYELHGSSDRTPYPGPGILPGGCFAGVPDSSCALSLLSNQPCGSRNQHLSPGSNYLLDSNGVRVVQPVATDGADSSNYSSSSWGFKVNEDGTSLFNNMHPEMGFGQISQPIIGQYTCELQPAQQSGRQYIEFEHSKVYDSSVQHVHWSL